MLIYLTHPQVRIDPAAPVPEWSLSELGVSRLAGLAGRPWLGQISAIFSSMETKAMEAAAILGRLAGIGVKALPEMGENDRSTTGFLQPVEFEAAADQFFAQPEASFRGWERAVDAQARISAAVDRALANAPLAANILFVGHGAVGTLLKCSLTGKRISRSEDQKPGGGQVFAYDLAGKRLACDWTPVEDWKGELS